MCILEPFNDNQVTWTCSPCMIYQVFGKKEKTDDAGGGGGGYLVGEIDSGMSVRRVNFVADLPLKTWLP